ncbi:long-chain-fatty-acid--coa ligase 5 [Anaeramoeba ignava]|uniref:Long-chain-fatty-acid--coa ligase 5 n=1 Tax=Anaeramoeba ignava TaxID=1746090 RepID=A0A9Q0LC47_ANAIG|nr:long-chain-fatty-acid--coa ligase 5 [Anaeramoeba ignava]
MGQTESLETKPTKPYVYLHDRENRIYRNRLSKGKDLTDRFEPDIFTRYDLLLSNAKKYKDKPALGKRKIEGNKLGDYEWITFEQFADIAIQFGSALKELGLKKGDSVAIYMKNCIPWRVAEDGSYAFSFVPVSLYDTLGEDSTEFILKHSDVQFVICSNDKIDKILDAKAKCEYLKYVVSSEPLSDEQIEKGKKAGMIFMNYDDFLESGKKANHKPEPPSPDDLATLMYTSGTTGNPKGVMLNHRNLIGAAAGGGMTAQYDVIEDDIFFSYLPLAHILERSLHGYFSSEGMGIGFYSGDIRNIMSDIQALKPTIMAGVPRIYSRIYDRVVSTIEQGGAFQKFMFDQAFAARQEALKEGRETPIWDKLVFNKLKAKLGGRMRMIISGSAPLSEIHHSFFRVCFCNATIQGYGMTETGASGTIGCCKMVSSGNVGFPSTCDEVKLVDVPEMGYVSDDTQQSGEIWIRGYNVFQGYYKDPEKTKETLTEDGWVMTGDIGRWNPNGTLSIIDRKKNIFKLAQGEYVAAEFLESIFVRCSAIAQIFVYGNSFQNYLVAIVVPDVEYLETIKQDLELEKINSDTLKNNKKIKGFILKQIDQKAKEENLKGFEVIKNILIEPDPFTIENSRLTDTMKIKRFQLAKDYSKEIEILYQELEEMQKEREKAILKQELEREKQNQQK